MTVHSRWLTSIAELDALGPGYDRMVLAAGDAGLFYQREWLARVWPHYETTLGATLALLIAEQDGEPIAMAPLALRTKGWTHARQRVLGFIGGTWDELDNWMPGFLFATKEPGEQARIMTVFADAIRQRDWDRLELRLMRSSPSDAVLFDQLRGLHATADSLGTPRARLDGGWAPYWASRTKRLTRIVERGRKRAAEDGVTIVHEVTDDVPIARRADVETLHRARQDRLRTAGRVRSSPFEDPDARRLFWSLVDWTTSRGQLRTHWLNIGGRTAAYVIALHHANTTFAYFNAIDPSKERYHPGSVILAGMIEREATDYGTTIVDMMAGANLTKTLLATEELPLTNLSLVNPFRRGARIKDAWIRLVRSMVSGQR